MKLVLLTAGLLAAFSVAPTAEAGEWKLAFHDTGSKEWEQNWFLEGAKATVRNSGEGMVFSAGPVPEEQASHAVLWTRRSFAGDVKIEYDYTRLDSMMDVTAVNILYIHATGLGTEESPTDIFLSTNQRDVPWMRSYFLNMNALHISYATSGPKRSHYVAARRYPAKALRDFNTGTQIQPIYENIDLFQPGETWHVTVVKEGNRLTFTVEREGETHAFEWDTSGFAPVTEGRIGFRHMWARSSRYKDIRVYLKADPESL